MKDRNAVFLILHALQILLLLSTKSKENPIVELTEKELEEQEEVRQESYYEEPDEHCLDCKVDKIECPYCIYS